MRDAKTASRAFLTAAVVGAVVASSVSLVDAILAVVLGRLPASLSLVTVPLSLTLMVLFLGYALTWLLVSSLARFFARPPLALLAVATGGFVAQAAVYVVIRGASTVLDWQSLLLFLAGCVVASSIFFLALQRIDESPRLRQLFLRLALSAPFILSFTMLFAVASGSGRAGPVWFLFLGYAIAIASVVAMSRRVSTRSLSIANLVLTLVLSLVPPLLFLVARAPRSPAVGSSERKPAVSVVLLTVDTLRWEQASCEPSRQSRMPNTSRLCRDGIEFTHAVSSAPWTLPAFASLMTGVSPLVHGAKSPSSMVPDALPTIAELLKGAGYRTTAILHNRHLGPRRNLARGFDEYLAFPRRGAVPSFGVALVEVLFRNSALLETTTTSLTDLGLRHIDANPDGGSFLWLHYFDPHQPYAPPRNLIADEESPPGMGEEFTRSDQVRSGRFSPNAAERAWIRKLYELEVQDVDENIGRLLDRLELEGLYEDSLIVLTSDHGEEFWEHGGLDHGHTLYDELLRVPLIIKPPSSARGVRIDKPVSIESLIATIADICELEVPNPFSAPSLRPLWESDPHDVDYPHIVSTGSLYYEDKIAIYFDQYKYIQSLVSGFEEIYDLHADEEERSSLAPFREDLVERARTLLAERRQEADEIRSTLKLGEETVPLDPVTLQQLRSLGYVD